MQYTLRYQFYDTRINHFGGRNARAGEFKSKRDLRRATSTNLRLINGDTRLHQPWTRTFRGDIW